MTPIFFVVVYAAGLAASLFRHPIYGLYTYLFTFYMAPNYNWWSQHLPEIRYLFICALVTLVSMLRLPRDPARTPWHKIGGFRLVLMFVVWNWLQLGWAVSFDWQLHAAEMFTKHLIIMVVIYRLIDSMERVRDFALAHVIGCFWFGYNALDAGGGRLEKIGGAVSGANELGVHVSTVLLVGGFLLLAAEGYRRWIIFGCLPFVANCLILTVSRGAFLGFVLGGAWGSLFVPKSLRARFRVAALLGVVLFAMLAHQQLIDRFVGTWEALTTDQSELDGSASSRSHIFWAGIRIGMDHPLGAGHKGTTLLSPMYMPSHVLSNSTGQRSAHNALAAVFAEHGVVGLVLYLGMIGWVLGRMLALRRSAVRTGSDDVQLSAAFTGAGLIAIYVSGNFSNNLDLEAQYWYIALLAVIGEVMRQREVELGAAVRDSRGGLGLPAGGAAPAHRIGTPRAGS